MSGVAFAIGALLPNNVVKVYDWNMDESVVKNSSRVKKLFKLEKEHYENINHLRHMLGKPVADLSTMRLVKFKLPVQAARGSFHHDLKDVEILRTWK